LGIKKEKTNRATEKRVLKDSNSSQSPDTQTCFSVPKKKVKIKAPAIIPKPVPKK
jgi:hypothetical protein